MHIVLEDLGTSIQIRARSMLTSKDLKYVLIVTFLTIACCDLIAALCVLIECLSPVINGN